MDKLERYKTDVLTEFSDTKLKAIQISQPKNGFSEIAYLNGVYDQPESFYLEEANSLVHAANGEWDWDDTAAGYQLDLGTVQGPANFDFLKQNRETFTGQIVKQSENK